MAIKFNIKGLPNFHQVSFDLFRSGQPNIYGIPFLAKSGIRCVVNLRAFHSDRHKIEAHGIHYEHIRMKTWHPEKEDIVRFLQIIGTPENRPALVHCKYGSDRTGLMVAVYRVVVEGWPAFKAIGEMISGGFGFHHALINLPLWLEALDYHELRRLGNIKIIKKKRR